MVYMYMYQPAPLWGHQASKRELSSTLPGVPSPIYWSCSAWSLGLLSFPIPGSCLMSSQCAPDPAFTTSGPCDLSPGGSQPASLACQAT